MQSTVETYSEENATDWDLGNHSCAESEEKQLVTMEQKGNDEND